MKKGKKLTVKEAAAKLGVPQHKMFWYCMTGLLPFERFVSDVFVSSEGGFEEVVEYRISSEDLDSLKTHKSYEYMVSNNLFEGMRRLIRHASDEYEDSVGDHMISLVKEAKKQENKE
jgi:hypothetical protein